MRSFFIALCSAIALSGFTTQAMASQAQGKGAMRADGAIADLSLAMNLVSKANAFEVTQAPPGIPIDPNDRDSRIPLPVGPPVDPDDRDPRAPLPPRIPVDPRDRDSNGDYSVFYRRPGRERWRLAGHYSNRYEVERVKRDLRREGYIVRVERDGW